MFLFCFVLFCFGLLLLLLLLLFYGGELKGTPAPQSKYPQLPIKPMTDTVKLVSLRGVQNFILPYRSEKYIRTGIML